MKLPDTLIHNLRDIHPHADAWLAELDHYIQTCEERWQLRVTGLVSDLSYNVVAFARGLNGAPYILKLSPPNSEFSQEIAALKLYDGDGICHLIDADDSVGVMLLERLEPGVSFWNIDIKNADEDDFATRTAMTLMQQLWRGVQALKERHEIVGDVRGGHGLMLCLELVGDREAKAPLDKAPLDKARVARVHEATYAHGVMVRVSGPNLILSPPLVVTEEDCDAILHALDAGLAAA